jgi:CheY-like chemotaxis protein/signal transduction histidine kinase
MTSMNERNFRRILNRNVSLPLGLGLLSAIFFIILIVYLLNVLKLVTNSDETLRQANEAFKLTIDLETGMRGFLISNDESFLQPYEAAKPRIAELLEHLKLRSADDLEQVNRLQRISGLQKEWDRFANDMFQLRRDNADYQTAISSGRGKSLTDAIRQHYEDYMSAERQQRAERNRAANRLVVVIVGLYLVVSLLLSGVLAFFGRRELKNLSDTYTQLLDQQAEHTEQLQRQAWLRSGQTQLAERLIGQLEPSEIGNQTLQFLARYLDLPVAAFYLRESSGQLRRIASYGFSRELETQNQSFYLAEGLVGQAAAGQQLIHLDSPPPNYLKVTSGLGSSSPRAILLMPTRNDEQANGVIELGLLRAVQERDLAFLELISGNVGSAIEGALYRRRLQEMLAETQQLNEEMQVQQEELRSSNEELEEQSRVLKESQAHLEAQQAELEQTNEQLAEQAEILARQRDALDEKNNALGEVQRLLEERADELQRASRYKSEFLANMSHELRTPLNSSLILAKLLADNVQGNLSEEQVRFAESIYSAGNDLLHLINDILDISKVEAGKLELRPETTPLDRVLDGLRQTFEPLAQQKQLGFSVESLASAPAELFTDRQRLEQILKNLLSNAVKFTDQGSVSLSVRPQDGGVAFVIRDSGIGIPKNQQQVIFEAFCQADGTTNRRFGGTGLGLSISRDLAGMLGGSISVESEEGKGSTFTLILPVTYEPAAEPPRPLAMAPSARPVEEPVAAPLAAPGNTPARNIPRFDDDRDAPPFAEGRTVLVIEDEPRFARILYELAHEMRYNCLVAHGADEGVELARSHLPAAVLLDMNLPDHSGLTVLQRLKEEPATRHVPVHVISVEDRSEAALQLGAIGYALKPTTREQLMEVFGKFEAKLSQKLRHVLVVEDDARQRDSIARLIGEDDVQITAVELGSQALELLASTVFDCMIIDLKLPDMNGQELLRRMSGANICSFPPVIVYTGRNLTRDEEAELMKYSRSIIIKGARSPERLLDEVTLFLHKVEASLSSEHQSMLRTARNRDKLLEGRRILLVDDDVRNIFALASALEQKGAVIEVARNGREALKKLDEVEDIDLVLMDVMMPEMDGYEATELIRKDPRWRKLPIIAVTAKAMQDDQERCRQAGANDYLAKPIELDRLLSLIRVWMPKLERI